eukprot:TRINITY_DN10864_c0_g1_i1.p1 TRINITY_DN10864_c0_g1~~TRINITY_DN10864_c0_g1_i1.p1  ORF type:complete len:743 (+),score=242.34 TRINITY_DN10864_c0_g1_i1:118-2229(+)
MPTSCAAARPTNVGECRARFLADPGVSPNFEYPCAGKARARVRRYGTPREDLLPLAQAILSALVHRFGCYTDFLRSTGGGVATEADVSEAVGEWLNCHAPKLSKKVKVRFRPHCAARASICSSTLIVSSDPVRLRRHELGPMLDHELGTHLLRRLNGRRQVWEGKRGEYRLCGKGDKQLTQTEEGLASLNTHLGQNKLLFHGALHYYAAARGAKVSFAELWHDLAKYVDCPVKRWEECVRVKRGLEDTSQAGAYAKDQCYLEGAVGILRQRRRLDFRKLHCARLSLADFARLEPLITTKGCVLPWFIRDPDRYLSLLDQIVAQNGMERLVGSGAAIAPRPGAALGSACWQQPGTPRDERAEGRRESGAGERQRAASAAPARVTTPPGGGRPRPPVAAQQAARGQLARAAVARRAASDECIPADELGTAAGYESRAVLKATPVVVRLPTTGVCVTLRDAIAAAAASAAGGRPIPAGLLVAMSAATAGALVAAAVSCPRRASDSVPAGVVCMVPQQQSAAQCMGALGVASIQGPPRRDYLPRIITAPPRCRQVASSPRGAPWTPSADRFKRTGIWRRTAGGAKCGNLRRGLPVWNHQQQQSHPPRQTPPRWRTPVQHPQPPPRQQTSAAPASSAGRARSGRIPLRRPTGDSSSSSESESEDETEDDEDEDEDDDEAEDEDDDDSSSGSSGYGSAADPPRLPFRAP